MLSENVVDLVMPGNRLLLPSRGIEVNIMAAAVPVKYASLFHELANQLATFHKAMSFFL